MKRLLLALIALHAGAALHAQPADLILRNGKVVLVDKNFRVVEAMAVRDGRVQAVGLSADIVKLGNRKTRVIDLQGRMVLPGLIDSHVHATGASMTEAQHEIPPMENIADVQAYIRTRAKVVPKGEWIRLSQVFITRLKEQRYPSRAELDALDFGAVKVDDEGVIEIYNRYESELASVSVADAIVTAPSALSATLSATLRALSAALGPRPAAAALRLRRGGGGVESLEGRRGHRAVAPRRPRGRAQHGPRAGPSADSGASDSSAAGESREDGAVGDGIVRAIGSVRPEGRRRRGG